MMVTTERVRDDAPLPAWRLVQIIGGSPLRDQERTAFLLTLSEERHDAVAALLAECGQRQDERRRRLAERRPVRMEEYAPER